jgi:glutamine amidotransferase
MIAIIDYGMGNLRSVEKGFARAGYDTLVTRDAAQIHSARGVVLPGVGAFSACMENLGKFGLLEPIRQTVRENKPFLGICLGFQLLFSESEEFGKQKGLDLFPGRVVGFQPADGLKIPHMGWNTLEKKKDSPFLEGVASGDYFYLVNYF